MLIISVLCDFVFEKYVGYTPSYTCFRYIFLSVPAFMCLKAIKIRKALPLILLSMFYLSLILYGKVPIWADSILPDGWEAQTSLGFFYTFFLYAILTQCYNKLKTHKLVKYISRVGTISWEVFLVQMVLLGSGIIEIVSTRLFKSACLQVEFIIIIVLSVSMLFGELYRKFLDSHVTDILLRIRYKYEYKDSNSDYSKL